MNRLVRWAAFVLLFGGSGRAKAESLLLITDRAGFAYNDIAPWGGDRGFPTTEPSPTINGLGTFAYSWSTFSVPFYDSRVLALAGGLFVGASTYGPGGTGQTASFQVDARFDFGPAAVRGFGFPLLTTYNPTFVLRVYDGSGRAEDFPLGPYRGFVGVTTDGAITGFRLSASALNGTASVSASEVFVNAAVPAPPGIVAAALGMVCVGIYARRGRSSAG